MTRRKTWATLTDDEAAAEWRALFQANLLQQAQSNAFWSDEIKQYRNDPVTRRDFALRHLPLPAAFQEAIIALRAIIRRKRKTGEDWEADMRQLYRLAAVDSFRPDYCPDLQVPGYSIFETIPRDRLISLPVDYHRLGTERLRLLNKTDTKWMAELYGKPAAHATLNDLHPEVWQEYKEKFRTEQSWPDRFEVAASRDTARPVLTDSEQSRLMRSQRPRRWRRASTWWLIAGLLVLIAVAAS